MKPARTRQQAAQLRERIRALLSGRHQAEPLLTAKQVATLIGTDAPLRTIRYHMHQLRSGQTLSPRQLRDAADSATLPASPALHDLTRE